MSAVFIERAPAQTAHVEYNGNTPRNLVVNPGDTAIIHGCIFKGREADIAVGYGSVRGRRPTMSVQVFYYSEYGKEAPVVETYKGKQIPTSDQRSRLLTFTMKNDNNDTPPGRIYRLGTL